MPSSKSTRCFKPPPSLSLAPRPSSEKRALKGPGLKVDIEQPQAQAVSVPPVSVHTSPVVQSVVSSHLRPPSLLADLTASTPGLLSPSMEW